MSQTLVLEIPDATWAELQRSAQVRHQRPEDLALTLLQDRFAELPESVESDPLIRLFGSIHSDLTDVAERHDEYIGASLFRSLRNSE